MDGFAYERGTIKVVWVKNDPSRIYSRMFDDLEEAKRFAKSKEDYIIFALVKQKQMTDFEWKLLPYGKHNLYKLALRLYQKYGDNIINLFKL